MLERMKENWNNITVDGVKTGAVIVTINVEVSKKARTRSTLRSNWSTPGNVPIGLHFIPQRHLSLFIVDLCKIPGK